jgi:hypothetical protein
MTSLADDPSWLPARIHLRSDGPHIVQWQHTGGIRCTHPFYRETMTAATGPRRETPLEDLDRLAQQLPGRAPDGLIFHLSRCGSTLVSQMLAALPQHTVLSEPAPVNDILWPGDDDALPPADRRASLLASVIRVLTRSRPNDEAAFIKCDAWHLLDLPLFRRVFPRTPVVLVYRDPLEIIVSHQPRRGIHMIPGQLDGPRLGVPFPPLTASGLDTFAARVLARLMDAALTHLPDTALLLHHRELPAAGLDRLLSHFQLDIPPAARASMLASASFHAKQPGIPYAPDSAVRQASAPPALRILAEEHTGALYAQLESRRAAQP